MNRISIFERGAQINRKLEQGVRLPPAEEMRNSGRRRTPEKRALLARIAEVARAQGREPTFPANY